MPDFVDIVVRIPADRMEAFRQAVLNRWGGAVVSVSLPSGAEVTMSLAEARRRMIADATARELSVLDALYRLPGHEGSTEEIAHEANKGVSREEGGEYHHSVLGLLGSLGAKLNRHVSGDRRRALHLWVEETTGLDGIKRYRMRPDFIRDVNRWTKSE